ncbi:MAG: SURF1 family protein [Alphaproteobacteria bacterium]|nr:SURF1 family protein [Alphaproteobacteria bacterium]MBL6940228.1 SURF1 family protein [Alphaproteobacteria bacterium]MBL7096864.1 SURF1 family protein [Alphaproteobacteria bacterium]
MIFRPYPGLTVAVAILLAILLGLGFWQLQRLQWKLGLIEQVHRNMAAAPISLDEAIRLGASAEYRRVTLHGRFDNAREAYIYGVGEDGVPVYHVITPLTTGDNRILLVDRGVVPMERQNPATRAQGQVGGETSVTGIWRAEVQPGAFTPPPDTIKRIWFVRSAGGIARVFHEKLAAPVIVEADATPNPGGLPRGGQTRVEFRNEHLQYAITWFLMAAGLLGVYIAFHISRGRLALKRPD